MEKHIVQYMERQAAVQGIPWYGVARHMPHALRRLWPTKHYKFYSWLSSNLLGCKPIWQ